MDCPAQGNALRSPPSLGGGYAISADSDPAVGVFSFSLIGETLAGRVDSYFAGADAHRHCRLAVRAADPLARSCPAFVRGMLLIGAPAVRHRLRVPVPELLGAHSTGGAAIHRPPLHVTL